MFPTYGNLFFFLPIVDILFARWALAVHRHAGSRESAGQNPGSSARGSNVRPAVVGP